MADPKLEGTCEELIQEEKTQSIFAALELEAAVQGCAEPPTAHYSRRLCFEVMKREINLGV